jgi:hypothetical protein
MRMLTEKTKLMNALSAEQFVVIAQNIGELL